jgi:hypothetical protein
MTTVRYPSGERQSYLFVANQYMDVVSRMDMESLDVTNIDVGERPYTMDITPDGTTVVVALRDGRGVSLIDARAGRETARVYAGFEPLDVAIQPQGRYAGVANFENNSVALIDVDRRRGLPLFAPNGPAAVDFTADGTRMLAVSWFVPALRAYDVETRETVLEKVFGPEDLEALGIDDAWEFWNPADYEDGPRMQALAAGPADGPLSGHALVALKYYDDFVAYGEEGFYPSFLLAVDWTTGAVDQALRLPDGAIAIGYAPNGKRAYVVCESHYTDFVANLVAEIEIAEDGTLSARFEYPVGEDPTSLAVNPERAEVYVVGRDAADLSVLEVNTFFQYEIGLREKPFTVSVSPSGRRIFVSHDNPLGSLSVVDADTHDVRFFPSLIYGDYIED